MARRLIRGKWRRRIGWVLLVLGVTLAHGLVTRELARSRAEWGAADKAPPPRLEIAFVRELAPTAPPPKPRSKPKPKPKPRSALAAAPAAEVASAPPLEPAPPPDPLEPVPVVEAAPADPAPAPAAAASEPAAPLFEWPPSTRLKYKLTGNYRGEIHGGAQVQWIRVGSRYQVHLDVWLGPPFAPIVERRMTSDGELGEAGLEPRRYDEETRIAFRAPRVATLQFEPDRIVMPNGSWRAPWPGVQDAASQFVQLTWLFTTQPQLLRKGNTVELPLALPRRVDRWVYDVLGEERLATPVGELDTFHLKPRREAKPGSDLTAEIWFAPTLQYLPVRIRIHQDAETFVDLLLETRPVQAER
jgi:hypothetical protein